MTWKKKVTEPSGEIVSVDMLEYEMRAHALQNSGLSANDVDSLLWLRRRMLDQGHADAGVHHIDLALQGDRPSQSAALAEMREAKAAAGRRA